MFLMMVIRLMYQHHHSHDRQPMAESVRKSREAGKALARQNPKRIPKVPPNKNILKIPPLMYVLEKEGEKKESWFQFQWI